MQPKNDLIHQAVENSGDLSISNVMILNFIFAAAFGVLVKQYFGLKLALSRRPFLLYMRLQISAA